MKFFFCFNTPFMSMFSMMLALLKPTMFPECLDDSIIMCQKVLFLKRFTL